MTVLPFPTATPKPDALALLAAYLQHVHPARGHGKTDCGEMLDGLTDAEHFVAWLSSRGLRVVCQ